jgi:hypothetical protein
MPVATTKPVVVTYFPLATSADCAAALEAALTIGFRGSVSGYMNATTPVWVVELSGGPLSQKAVMVSDGESTRPPTVGDVFVWDGTHLLCFTAAAFAAAYEATP